MLAMSISQFVTGFCDSPPSTVVKRRSMYEAAEDVDMPQSWVEIRHEITHGKMPSTPVLKRCASEAVEWLRSHYWQKVVPWKNVPKTVHEQDDVLDKVVSSLLLAKMDDVKGGMSGQGDAVIERIVVQASTTKHIRRVASILVQKSFLIPKRKM
jgi:hypothetical protein